MPRISMDDARGRNSLPRTLGRGVLWVALCATLPPQMAHAEPLSKLEGRLSDSFRLKAADAQVDYAKHLLSQETNKEGLQIIGRLDVGHHRQVVTDDLSRSYDAISPRLGLSYPLFGSRARQLESVMDAQTQLHLNTFDFDEVRRTLLYDLRRTYILAWQYQQQAQLAERHVEALAAKEAAARKLHEKGVWTEGNYLQFSSTLAAARDDVTRFRGLQQLAMNAVRTTLSQLALEFKPEQPDLPPVCLSYPELSMSAQRHSTALRKLEAKLQALKYNQEIEAGSSVNSDVHLGVVYVNEFSGSRSGYQAAAGVSISMPANFQEANRANRDRLNAAVLVQRSLIDQARLDLQAAIRAAMENFQLAKNNLDVTQEQAKANREALREVSLQFDRVPQVIFDVLIQKMSADYQAALAELKVRGEVYMKTSDLLLLAPDSCVPSASAMDSRLESL